MVVPSLRKRSGVLIDEQCGRDGLKRLVWRVASCSMLTRDALVLPLFVMGDVDAVDRLGLMLMYTSYGRGLIVLASGGKDEEGDTGHEDAGEKEI